MRKNTEFLGWLLLAILILPKLSSFRQPQMKGDGKEWGFTVCNKDGELVKGPEAVGHHYGVDVPVRCPPGAKPAAIFHTHPFPPGLAEPSSADIQAAQRFRIPYLCIGQPESGKVTCHRVPRKR